MSEREPRRRVPQFYGQPSEHRPLEWTWVESRLVEAGTYWVIARNTGPPHPRPVWGVWLDQELYLSIGTPAITRTLANDSQLTVHLESGVDVVIVEGLCAVTGPTPEAALQAYQRKYDWDYDVAAYGELRRVRPTAVISWRAAGEAGRGSFQETGSWRFD
jgi:hypothetical protein